MKYHFILFEAKPIFLLSRKVDFSNPEKNLTTTVFLIF